MAAGSGGPPGSAGGGGVMGAVVGVGGTKAASSSASVRARVFSWRTRCVSITTECVATICWRISRTRSVAAFPDDHPEDGTGAGVAARPGGGVSGAAGTRDLCTGAAAGGAGSAQGRKAIGSPSKVMTSMSSRLGSAGIGAGTSKSAAVRAGRASLTSTAWGTSSVEPILAATPTVAGSGRVAVARTGEAAAKRAVMPAGMGAPPPTGTRSRAGRVAGAGSGPSSAMRSTGSPCAVSRAASWATERAAGTPRRSTGIATCLASPRVSCTHRVQVAPGPTSTK